MVDKSIQVSPAMDSQSTQCSIRIDEPSLYCPNCYIRQRGDMTTTDHSYIRKKKENKRLKRDNTSFNQYLQTQKEETGNSTW